MQLKLLQTCIKPRFAGDSTYVSVRKWIWFLSHVHQLPSAVVGVLDEVGSLTHTEKHFLPARCGHFALAIESTEILFPCKHIQVLELFVLWHTHKSQFLLYSQRSNRISVGTYVKVFILWSCQVVLSQLIQWLLLQWPATTKQLVLIYYYFVLENGNYSYPQRQDFLKMTIVSKSML